MSFENSGTNIKDGLLRPSLAIILMVTIILVYFIGVYLHIKVIKVCRKEMQMTWKLDIIYSISTLFYFSLAITMFVITYLNISEMTDLCSGNGKIVCKGIKFITFLGRMYICSHSLVISLMKYCMVVLYDKVRKIGKYKVEITFFLVDILYPAIAFILLYLIKNDDKFGADPYEEKIFLQNSFTITNRTILSLFNHCKNEDMETTFIRYIFNIVQTFICWILAISTFINSINILGVFLYFQIFKCMNR